MDAIAAIEQEQAALKREAERLAASIDAIEQQLQELAPRIVQAQANAERNPTKTLLDQRDKLEAEQANLERELMRKRSALQAVHQEQQDAAQRMEAAQKAAREAADAALLAEARALADKLDRSGLKDKDTFQQLLAVYNAGGKRMGWNHPANALVWRVDSIVFNLTGRTTAEYQFPLVMRENWKPVQTMREAMRLE